MKKFLVALLSALCLTLFCGCNIQNNPHATITYGDRFVITKEWTTSNTVYVEMYDKTTKVMYVYIKLSESGSLQVLVDENGKPLLWEGE